MPQVSSEPAAARPKREFSPKFWDGMVARGWFTILIRNRFNPRLLYLPVVLIICMLSICHSILGVLQNLIIGWRANKTKIEHPPIFVIGHWRSGTTMLHELMVRDERNGFPSTYACFAPAHFLITDTFAFLFLNWLLPSNRQIDNMPAGWKLPQEDEFAICNLGEHSPYATLAFPNNPPLNDEFLTLEHVSPAAREHWKWTLMRFMRNVTYREQKRLVLKSPTHTARVKVLLEMFPDARFIHIIRTPYKVIPSTINLWKTLYELQGMQKPTFEGLEDRVFETFHRMYESYEADKALIPPKHFAQLRYEDLVKDPIGQMRAVYDQLGLTDFEAVAPKIQDYLDQRRDYQTNKYEPPAEMRDRITRECAEFMQRYGYEGSGTDEGGRMKDE